MRSFALVALGGVAGTLSRHGVAQWCGEHLFPVGTFGVNVAGSFLLGALLTALVLRGDDSGARRDLRLLLGTGFLGGFTTYSALAVETQTLLRDDRVALGLTYALGSVILGLVAAGAGIAAAHAGARTAAR